MWIKIQRPQHSGVSAVESIPRRFFCPAALSPPTACPVAQAPWDLSADSELPWLCLFSFESQYSETRCPVYLFEQWGEKSKGFFQAVDFHLLGAGLFKSCCVSPCCLGELPVTLKPWLLASTGLHIV